MNPIEPASSDRVFVGTLLRRRNPASVILRIVAVVIVSCGLLVRSAIATSPDHAAFSAKVDALFAPWNKTDSPGAACAVIQDGKVVHARGYGMADLERGEPVSPQSVFYTASLSKQFTAACIVLLVLEGKVSLDADIRRYVPEMAPMAVPVTVRHLLYHTSGLRDYFGLLTLTGWRDTDYVNNDMIVKLLAQQRTLNFESGTKHMYSNSNYVLLAEIVKRVSGRSLRAFADERIFRPLGMTQTRFDDDHREAVPQRAIGYLPKEGGYQPVPKNSDEHGAGGLLTTIEDLALWDANFTSGRVGGKAFLDLIQKRGDLDDGRTLNYAAGLEHRSYRGLAVVGHNGSFGGFRTQLTRFPKPKLTVIVLGNLSSLDPAELTDRMADLYLEGRFPQPKPQPPASSPALANRVILDPRIFATYVGDYSVEKLSGVVFQVRQKGDQYFGKLSRKPQLEIFALSTTRFIDATGASEIEFHQEPDGSVMHVSLRNGAMRLEAHRILPYVVPPEELAAYCGEYYSDELETTCQVEMSDGRLVLRQPRVDPAKRLKPRDRDDFTLEGDWRIVFTRGPKGEIAGVSFSDRGPVQNVIFRRKQPGT